MTNDAAVAWMGPNGQLIENARFQSRLDGMPDFGDLSGYQPLYSATTVAELRARVAELTEALTEVAATLAWVSLGECRSIHDGPIMPSGQAVAFARQILTKESSLRQEKPE